MSELRNKLLGVSRLPTIEYYVEEWDVTVYMKHLNAREQAVMEDKPSIAKTLICILVDEDGETPLFKLSEESKVAEKFDTSISYRIIKHYNTVREEITKRTSVEELKKS